MSNKQKVVIEDGKLIEIHVNGVIKEHEIMHPPITNFHVLCNHCGKIYDLTYGNVTHRYHDCDEFTTPCCNREHADTREWKSFPDYTRINKIFEL